MKRPAPRYRHLLWLTPALFWGGDTSAQIDRLRQYDDQFIQGLREQGLSDLLERFVENVEDEGGLDPVAHQQLIVAQQEFLATERFDRAVEKSGTDPAAAEALFLESRSAYEAMIDAQTKLIEDHEQDERAPIWQTDLATMLMDVYLPRYYNNAVWFYEFGVPSAEQAEAYQRSVVLAFEMVADARDRIERLTERMGRDGGVLRGELEEMNIFFKLREDYGKRRTPFWFAHCAYYMSLLPADHPYYQSLGPNNRVPNQANSAQAERSRLVDSAEAVATGGLLNDPEIGMTMRLLAGRVLVSTGDADRADEGVAEYLEDVLSAEPWQAFIASLAKARGKEADGDIETATDILAGMGNHVFVREQLANGNFYPRLIAADLMHRMLMKPVDQARGADRQALMAEAYEKPYLPLINNDPGNRFGPFLYQRWSDQVGPDDDPQTLPPAVRMGIGQMKTNVGGGMAQELINSAPTANIGIPADREREEQRRAVLRAEAEEIINRAVAFNETLISEDTDPSLRDRGLMNLAFNKYYLAELAKHYGGPNADSVEPYFEVAQLWARIGKELPDSALAERAMGFAVTLLHQFDNMANTGPQGVTEGRFRDAYRDAISVMYEYWPNHDTAHALRVYTGYYVYELSGDLENAIEVYRGMPSDHASYFEARRQMILAMQKQYDHVADELRQLELAGPAEDNEAGRRVLELAVAPRVEDLERRRRELLDTAEFLLIDAEDEAEQGDDDRRRFSAKTAQGGALVAIAAMESDGGDAGAALDLLEGFENDYTPDGQLAHLVRVQPDPANAAAQLDGLIQSAQERRILALVQAEDFDRIGDEAEAMIEAYPDVAAGVVNGVLRRIEDQIESLEIARKNALLEINRDQATGQIETLAGVAVELSNLLVEWAKANGYADARLMPFETGLCRALMLANRPGEAIPLMEHWLEMFPNNFDVVMLTGDCIIAEARRRGDRSANALDPGLQLYYKVILYYNAQATDKPPRFWSAWLKVLETMDFAGGDLADEIGDKVRMLRNRVDEDLGGPEYKDRILEIASRHLGN